MQKFISENLFSFFSIIALAIGGIFALVQWHESLKIRRSEFINQIIEKLRFDEKMAKVMYMMDYNQSWYDCNFHGGDKEFIIDKLLSYLSYICYLTDTHHITRKESSILEYELRRACESFSVQSYLFNIYHFSMTRKSPCSFQYLIDFGLKNKIIDKGDFLNNKSKKYPKYLNF